MQEVLDNPITLPLTVPQGSPMLRVMGTETEYGISVVGDPHANPMTAANMLVNAYARWQEQHLSSQEQPISPVRAWDFARENPLRDARGFDLARDAADPSQLTDEQTGMMNLILYNGARFYVDHAHPEFSSPETTNALAGLVWDKAGELIVARAAQQVKTNPPYADINLYKNKTDNKGASYGSHENYLMDRQTAFADIVRLLTPFLVTRQVVTGAGRVGLAQDGHRPGFQISQRADFFEVEVGLETTLKRPIINTRDEPHADEQKYRRLHVIIGDANLAHTSLYLKLGTTSLVLAMIEDGWLDARAAELSVDQPVLQLHEISHDPTLQHQVLLADGRRMSAVQLQMVYAEHARTYAQQRCGGRPDPHTEDVLTRWEQVLHWLETDPMRLCGYLDWVAKWQLLQGYRQRDGLQWEHPRLGLVDLQYSDVRPGKGLYHRLVQSGRMRELVDEQVITDAVTNAPTDTRAWFRGQCVRKFGSAVAAAAWDSLVFDLPGTVALQRVPMREPLRGTAEHVQQLLDACHSPQELVQALSRRD